MSEIFLVEFVGTAIIDLPMSYIGLNHLRALKALARTDIPSDVVQREVYAIKCNKIEVSVPEKIVYDSKHFENVGKIQVRICQEKQLNKYVKEIPIVTISSYGVRSAGIERKINKDEILAAWELADYPLEWTEKP